MDIDDRNTLNSSSFLNHHFPTSLESSFIDDKKIESATNICRNNDIIRSTHHFYNTFDNHAKSVDFSNTQNKLLFSNGFNKYTKVINENIIPNENQLNKAFILQNLGRNQQNSFYPYLYSIDPLIYNPQIYTFNDSQNQKHLNNLYNSEEIEKKILLDQIYLYFRDQNGCRILQKNIEEKNQDFLTIFYEKVY